MSRSKLSWPDFKPGMLLWLKTIMIIGFIIGLSYLLSKLFFLLGILFYAYFFIFVSPAFIGAPFGASLIAKVITFLTVIAFPLYLLIAINYFYLYFKKKKTIWWLTTIFVLFTILYFLGIILGWLTFLVWHPL